ncbi:uncharacterized protein GGS22DRAFT_194166 [Annulohypoxylon maeteangense]|uniref:uncharacterized protein n=1 Tax=Annulohypoxylon maeteangense TaxID=1927788 RepID=UPI002007C8EC|nr:uncharacterized protein GGS22DRAFT_194166 [Annulohypoxylon maeteangense]KAI0889819.1 hypothetical protein GGS22DRAFT_194166 [Annulohypoxylon maeteangense]
MSFISRLPESTTRLLGSSLVITTPTTLVKELIDNSIDAKASSIEVIVSTDTVKKIEVRDNGNGIHPDDYDALGRRGHTSKLRSFEELKTQSVKTLGFRGEALASANSLAQVTVTTKIASEPIAAILHIIPNKGGVSKQQPTSAPIGTTVSITNLFGKLPVREQVAIKESSKTIDKIREVLRSYAMARPQLRLSLKVLQSPKQNWSYSPKSDACVKEAAIQLFGADITTNCFKKTFEINELPYESSGSNDHNPMSKGKYMYEAFILKPNCDPSKAPKLRYFSVDGRPITGKRGTMKKLLSIYIEQINTAFRHSSSATILKDCFISLNIRCPLGSYDANIEPSKDDVLFSDENIVLDGFKDLCKEVYEISTISNSVENSSSSDIIHAPGTQESSLIEPQAQSDSRGISIGNSQWKTRGHIISQPKSTPQSQQDESIIAHHPPHTHLKEILQVSGPTNTGFTPINAPILTTQNGPISTGAPSFKDISPNAGYTQCRADMSTDFNEYSHKCSRKKRPRPSQPHEDEASTVEYSIPQDVNPWVIAKMNTPTRSKERAVGDSVHENSSLLPVFGLSMTPDPPILRHAGAAPRDLDVPPSQQYLNSQETPRQLRPRVPGGPYRSPMSSPPEITSQKAMKSAKIPASLISRRHHAYTPWSPPSSAERIVSKSDLLIGNEQGRVLDGMKQTEISFRSAGGKSQNRRLRKDSGELDHQNIQDGENDGENGLQEMLEAAKRSLNHQLSQENGNYKSDQKSHKTSVRPKVGVQRQPITQISIDQEQGSSSKIKEPTKTTLSNDDPRAYLLRRQKSMATQEKSAIPKKHMRIKSSLLPLENVPPDDQMHFTVLVEVSNVTTLRTAMKGCAAYDNYVERGAIKNGLEMDLDTGRKVEKRLKSLLQEQCGMPDSKNAELEFGLCSLLKGKGTIVA